MTDTLQPSPSEEDQEVELKYRVAEVSIAEGLIEAGTLGSLHATDGPTRTTAVEDRYVDTTTGSLAAAGFALRLRQRGEDTIVSVKSLAASEAAGGAVRRQELEGPAVPGLPPADWPASDARALVLEHAGDRPLVDRVAIRQRRRTRLFGRDDARVELSLDEVDVMDGLDSARPAASFVELEVELRAGDEAILGEIGALLDAQPGLTRSPHSKLETALAAIAAVPEVAVADVPGPTLAPGPTLVPGRVPGVTGDDHVAEAARKVLRFHLARMLQHEPGTRSGTDPVDVHKMRVATRRQRAAWRVFGEAFRPGRTKRYRNGLRDIAGRLGAVRDLDVLLEGADAYRADLPTTEQRALEPLLGAWRTHREDARRLLVRELDSDAYRRWLDDYVDFVRTDGAAARPVGPVEPHRIRDTAPSRIWAAYEGVRAYEPVLRWADVETLHDLRIAGKWLRYTLEFVREALGPESAPLIARVTALQDHLGLMHDADVSASMARTFLVEHAGDLSALESAAIGRYLVDRERETARLKRTVGTPWRAVAGMRYRQALGRVVAGL